MQPLFDHEKLRVYQAAISLVAWCEPILERLPRALAAHDQLDRASTSIPLNIAEGNGKFTSADRCKFFDIARGSALEAAACLDVLVAKQKLKVEDVSEGKCLLADVVSMLVSLIKHNSSGNRVYEVALGYGAAEGD